MTTETLDIAATDDEAAALRHHVAGVAILAAAKTKPAALDDGALDR